MALLALALGMTANTVIIKKLECCWALSLSQARHAGIEVYIHLWAYIPQEMKV